MITTDRTESYRGCRLAARHGDYWHAVSHDFASETLCGIRIPGSGLTEHHDAPFPCPACSAKLPARKAA